ncbi:hypothetical protein [Amycolatopsis sp. NPDC004169]|uniref:hypothetical protein n=1 Tax=Amycolatopsis sp. NPDC004169 TaxID=3154453 RepID=UPI0033B504EF
MVGVVSTAVVVAANLDGALSFVERFTGTTEISGATPHPPTEQRTTENILPSISSTPAPREELPDTVSAPPSRETTKPPPAPLTAAVRPTRAGALVVNIKMGTGGKIGPSEYRAGSNPGANVDVFDDVGQLSSGCYPSWTLLRAGAEVHKVRNGRCTSGGITMFNFGDSLDTPGSYKLQVDIVTEAGQSGSASVDFTVR